MKDKRIKLLRDEPIPKAINNMALPAIIGMLVMAIYNIADTMFVAWIGKEATSATQVVFPLMLLPSAIGLGFGIGGGNYISRLLGKKDYETGEKVIATSMVTGVIIGIIMTILTIIFLEDILSFFGASPENMELAKSYGFYIALGSVVVICNMVMNNSLRSEGSGKLPMIALASGSLINIALDPLFIFGLGWGVAGAAIATTLSRCITFVILIVSYLKHKSIVKLNFKKVTFKWDLYREILTVGTPTFLRQILVSIALAVLNKSAMISGGINLLAAIAIVTKVTMLPLYVIFGFGQGFQPVVGYNIGAKNKERVMESLKYTILICVGIVISFDIILNLFANNIMVIFKATGMVSEYAKMGLRYYAIALILTAISNNITVFYQALGKGKESLLLSISRQGMFFIPVVYLLAKIIGIQGVLASQMVADILTLILSMIILVPFIKSKSMEKEIGGNFIENEECA